MKLVLLYLYLYDIVLKKKLIPVLVLW